MKLIKDFFDALAASDPKTKGKNPEEFDVKKERELLKEYRKYKGQHNSNEYFAALPMIDFYYKFRNLSDSYLKKCMDYCFICIGCLNSPDMKSDIAHGIRIPAFRKLIIIYENQGEYKKAADIAEQALRFSGSDKAETEYYAKKLSGNKKKISG